MFRYSLPPPSVASTYPEMSEEPYDFAEVFQALFVPKQKPAPAAVPEDKMAFISTYPPLGQVSQMKDETFDVLALLEVPKFLAQEPWQLAPVAFRKWRRLGRDSSSSKWTRQGTICSTNAGRTALTPVLHCPLCPVRSSLNFTVKFRSAAEHEWRWIREEQDMGDGIVIMDGKPTLEMISENLSDLIHDLNPNVTWKSHMSQSPGTRLLVY